MDVHKCLNELAKIKVSIRELEKEEALLKKKLAEALNDGELDKAEVQHGKHKITASYVKTESFVVIDAKAIANALSTEHIEQLFESIVINKKIMEILNLVNIEPYLMRKWSSYLRVTVPSAINEKMLMPEGRRCIYG